MCSNDAIKANQTGFNQAFFHYYIMDHALPDITGSVSQNCIEEAKVWKYLDSKLIYSKHTEWKTVDTNLVISQNQLQF